MGATADNPEGRHVTRLEYDLAALAGKVIIHYPVEKEDELRPIIDPEEARELIETAPMLDDDTFDKPQSWTLREHFIGRLREGDCREAMRVVKTMHSRIDAATAHGRKPKACYTRVYEEASARLYAELCLSLGKSQEEVAALLRDSFARAGV